MATSDRHAVLGELLKTGVVAVIRADSGQELVEVCRALSRGGVAACEITMTTPGALEAIAEASRQLGDEALIGAGSVLDAATARAAILAGSRFIFSPAPALSFRRCSMWKSLRWRTATTASRFQAPSRQQRFSPRGAPEPMW